MSQGLKMRRALAVAGIGLLLAFQNCSQAPEGEDDSSSYESRIAFAYEAKLDTIAYMSCSGMGEALPPNRRGYFTIRAGAYNRQTGGLGLTQQYIDETKFYNTTERARILGISDKNSNTRLSLSIRSSTNYQAPWVEGQRNVGEELDSMLPPLDSQAVAGPLGGMKTAGALMNYFPGSHTQRLMEGSLRYYNFENTANLTRNSLNNGESMLVLGYSSSSDESDIGLRSPAADPLTGFKPPSNSAYGTGHRLSFSLPAGYSSGEPRVLMPGISTGITEVDLVTGQQKASNWACSTSTQFMVVRPEDLNRITCARGPDRYADANEMAALAAIRRVLRVEDWYVDMTRRCIVPKGTGDYCYGPLNGRTIQYGVANCINSPQNLTMCPHFVSVCIRQ